MRAYARARVCVCARVRVCACVLRQLLLAIKLQVLPLGETISAKFSLFVSCFFHVRVFMQIKVDRLSLCVFYLGVCVSLAACDDVASVPNGISQIAKEYTGKKEKMKIQSTAPTLLLRAQVHTRAHPRPRASKNAYTQTRTYIHIHASTHTLYTYPRVHLRADTKIIQ